ncbi:MAG TPA: ABC transporter ATP-binding protein [Spirochaetia bacterium]|nr:ABC transporter ATP-binding protein [Spirochaetia bacterium]
MEQEKIISGYDPALVGRLFRYLKPYRMVATLGVIALAVATVAELLLPVILQHTIDHYLVNTYSRVSADKTNLPELRGARITESDVKIGAFYYIPDFRLKTVTGVQKDKLIRQGVVEKNSFYVFPVDSSLRRSFADKYHSIIISDTAIASETGATPPAEKQRHAYVAVAASNIGLINHSDLPLLRSSDIDGLRRAAGVFGGLLIGQLLFGFLQVYLTAFAGQGVMKDIRLQLFRHTVRQSLRFLGGNPVGKLVTRLTNDVETVNELFTSVLVSLLQDVALMLGVVVTLFSLNVTLGVVTIATMPPVVAATLVYRVKARDAYRLVRLWVSRVNTYLSEHLSGMIVVQLFGRENHSQTEFDERNRQLNRSNLTQVYVFATFRPIIDLFSSVSVAIIIYFGARFMISGIVSLGVLVAFINLIQKFYQPVMDISEKFTIFQSAMAGSERVFELLDTVDRITDAGSVKPGKVRGELIFDHVCFGYREGEPVIRDLSFRVDPGQTVAIVGYTGAGKTTIANLLTRLWDLQDGRILLDGVDIRDYPLDVLRTAIQPIQQDLFLFSDTIRENILLGRAMTDEQLMQAARIAQADDFIQLLPGKYGATLSEGASNISTGQRQLISFARVVAHDPRIIIMDEATANIDTETERLIQRALDALLANRTSLVIAHRLSTIKHADNILVLSEGELVEQGTHSELLAAKGAYYNLYRLQYSTQENADSRADYVL